MINAPISRFTFVIIKQLLLAVESAADVLWVDLHLPPEKGEDVPPAGDWRLLQRRPYFFRRDVRRNDHVLHLLTRVVMLHAERLQHDRVLQKSRYTIRNRHVLLRKREARQRCQKSRNQKIKKNKNKNVFSILLFSFKKKKNILGGSEINYHGVEAGAEVVGGHEDVIGAVGPIPERVFHPDVVNGGGNEGAGVAYRREAIDGAEVAGHVDGDEEEVGFVGVNGQRVAGEQGPVNGDLGGEQVGAAPLVFEPIRVVFRWQIVNVNLQSVEQCA